MLSNILHIHISNSSSRIYSFRHTVQVSAPYNATLYTKHFTSLFIRSLPKGPQKMLLFLLKTSFAIAILCFISWQQFMLLLISHPKYLKLSTFFTDSSLILMSIFLIGYNCHQYFKLWSKKLSCWMSQYRKVLYANIVQNKILPNFVHVHVCTRIDNFREKVKNSLTPRRILVHLQIPEGSKYCTFVL